MFSLEISMLGVALALDAAVASFAVGILNMDQSVSYKIIRGFMICFLFGFFQALMIWLGSHMGYYFSFSSYGYLFQLLVAAVFIGIGVKVLKESLDEDEEPIVWGFFPLVLMAFGTSIDALAAGISLGTLPETHLTSLEIGFITFVICSMGYGAAFFLKSLPTNWLLRAASLIFFFLGGQILYQHYL